MSNVERLEILDTALEGNRKFFKVRCKVCEEVLERVRSDYMKRARCSCTRKIPGKPLQEGQRFGKLVVLGRDLGFYDGKNVKWIMQCDCGERKSIQASQLRSGSTTSCGCILEEKRGSKLERHGMTGTKEYNTWLSIVARTGHPFESTKRWYYDKGIGICEEWRMAFTKFYEDMGPCPKGYSIDRIDPEKDYCKENCRWASLPLQSINKGISNNNTSGYKGVSETKYGSWVAYIYIDHKRFHLGTYATKEEAHEAREKGEEKYWSHIKE